MSRLNLIDPKTATGPARELLTGIQRKLGFTPNFLRVFANSPAALKGYLGLSSALGGGSLPRKITERIALATAEGNGCQYCVSAHTALAKQAGLDDDEILAARTGTAHDTSAAAVLAFVAAVLENHGDVTRGELDALRTAGFDDGQVVEILTHVALNTLTNYLGKVGQIDIDFPEVSLLSAAPELSSQEV